MDDKKERPTSVVVFGVCLLIPTLQHRRRNFGEVSTASASAPCTCLRRFFAKRLSLNSTFMQALQVSPQASGLNRVIDLHQLNCTYQSVQATLFAVREYSSPVSPIIRDPPPHRPPITHTRFSKIYTWYMRDRLPCSRPLLTSSRGICRCR